ncbi:hypothetical protein BU202_01535 [Streptococcus cuniculi]|uniref:Uncharacterized protein n=1 Tax=Streptococcus cuniculi TaxID=1432788 RepID=A0A1Q8EB25_9STRE|nr:hypothetical protein BU202_01535 [Streptococcus cuniculi]
MTGTKVKTNFRGTTQIRTEIRSCSYFYSQSSATNTDICADFSTPPLSVTDKLTIPLIGFIVADFLGNCNCLYY